jgi:hypothetical protein
MRQVGQGCRRPVATTTPIDITRAAAPALHNPLRTAVPATGFRHIACPDTATTANDVFPALYRRPYFPNPRVAQPLQRYI